MAIVRSPRRKGFGVTLSSLDFLDALLSPAVDAAGYRLVRLRLMGGKIKTLQVMAERPDGGMDVDDCAQLSRRLSEVLEAADPITDEYVLEVSSPGIDRPLTAAGDFERFAGHEARVELKQPIEGRRRYKGTIAGLQNGEVAMEVPGEEGPERVLLPLSGIAEAKLIMTDRLIQESLKARDARRVKTNRPE